MTSTSVPFCRVVPSRSFSLNRKEKVVTPLIYRLTEGDVSPVALTLMRLGLCANN